MRTPRTVRGLEELSRVRLSRSFFMRDFLYSDISNLHGIPNLPADPDLAIAWPITMDAPRVSPKDAIGSPFKHAETFA